MTTYHLSRRAALGGLAAIPALALFRPIAAQEQAGRWRRGPPMPLRVQEIYPAMLDGRIYVAGGLASDGGFPRISDALLGWNGSAESWQEHAPLPIPTHHIACAPLDGRLLCAGGFITDAGGIWRNTAAVHVFDPETESWSEGPGLPGAQAEAVPLAQGGRVHLVGGRVPIGDGAGYDDNGDTARHLVLSGLQSEWEEAAPLPSPRNSSAGAVIGDGLHIVGGRTVSGGTMAEHLRYDPAADRWETLAPLPEASVGPPGSGGLAAAAIGERLFAFGGEWMSDGGGVYPNVWMWDASDRWEVIGEMPLPRHGLGAVTLGEEIATIGGATERGAVGTSAAVELFRP